MNARKPFVGSLAVGDSVKLPNGYTVTLAKVDRFAAFQIAPKMAVVAAFDVRVFTKKSMVFATNLIHCVAECFQEVFVGMHHGSIHLELDDGL